MDFVYLLVGVVLLYFVGSEIATFKTGVPTVTSWPSVRRKMVALLQEEAARKAAAGEAFSVIDLGSGTGRLALDIGRALPEVRVLGVEFSLFPFWVSRLRALVLRRKNVTFQRGDFWACDVSGFPAAVIYINEKIRDRMAAKLQKELPSGALVLSNETHLPGWEPTETHQLGALGVKLVVYRRLGGAG